MYQAWRIERRAQSITARRYLKILTLKTLAEIFTESDKRNATGTIVCSGSLAYHIYNIFPGTRLILESASSRPFVKDSMFPICFRQDCSLNKDL